MYYQVSMAMKMATVDKAFELLEKLRSASWDPAVQGICLDVIILWMKGFLCVLSFRF